MEHHSFLINILFYLVAAIIMVPLAKRLGMGAVLGYLVAGVVIGPWGLGLIKNVEVILSFSEFGVVLLLFLIGLELEPKRLWLLPGLFWRSTVGATCKIRPMSHRPSQSTL